MCVCVCGDCVCVCDVCVRAFMCAQQWENRLRIQTLPYIVYVTSSVHSYVGSRKKETMTLCLAHVMHWGVEFMAGIFGESSSGETASFPC